MIDVSKSNEKSAKITEQRKKAKEESENKEIFKNVSVRGLGLF